MSEQLLHRADVIAGFEQVGGEGVAEGFVLRFSPKGVAGDALVEASECSGLLHRLLEATSPFSPHQLLISVAFSCILAVDAITCDCIYFARLTWFP